MLTGKYNVGNLPKGPRGLLFRQILPGIQPLTDTLQQIASSRRKTASQVTVMFPLFILMQWRGTWLLIAAMLVVLT